MVLDIGDTPDIVHGHQKLAEWNARYDGRCFLPIHIHDTATGLLVAVLLRPGKTPGSAMPWRGPGDSASQEAAVCRLRRNQDTSL